MAKVAKFYPQALAILKVTFEDFTLKSGDKVPLIIEVIPTQATIHKNQYIDADTFSMTFDGRDLPIHPDQVQNMQVEIYLYNKKSLGEPLFAGNAREATEEFSNLLATNPIPTIVGKVDNVSYENGVDGEWVTVQGRDMTAIFADKPWGFTKAPAGKPLDVTLKAMMNDVQNTFTTHDGKKVQIIEFDYAPGLDKGKIPIVQKGRLGKVAKKKKKDDENKTGGHLGSTVKQKDSTWNVMYTLAVQHGYILYVDGLKVILAKMKTLTEDSKSNLRKLVFGRNIYNMLLERNMGKEIAPIIQVRCYNAKLSKRFSGQFPATGRKITTGVGTDYNEMEQINLRYQNITSDAICEAIAENIYISKARTEATLRLITDDLTDIKARNAGEQELSMLNISSGDALAIVFDMIGDRSLKEMTPGQRERHLTARGYKAKVAAVIANNYDTIDYFKMPYRVREATLDFSSENGIKIEVEAGKFILLPEEMKNG